MNQSPKLILNKEAPKPKQYFLSAEEKMNIESRQQLIKQYQYLIHVINSDVLAYTKFVVLERLKIPPETQYALSPDNTFLTVPTAIFTKEAHANPSPAK